MGFSFVWGFCCLQFHGNLSGSQNATTPQKNPDENFTERPELGLEASDVQNTPKQVRNGKEEEETDVSKILSAGGVQGRHRKRSLQENSSSALASTAEAALHGAVPAQGPAGPARPNPGSREQRRPAGPRCSPAGEQPGTLIKGKHKGVISKPLAKKM